MRSTSQQLRSDLRVSTMTNVALATLLALTVVPLLIAVTIIAQVSDTNKAQQRAFLCFDAEGHYTDGPHFKECRVVALREFK